MSRVVYDSIKGGHLIMDSSYVVYDMEYNEDTISLNENFVVKFYFFGPPPDYLSFVRVEWYKKRGEGRLYAPNHDMINRNEEIGMVSRLYNGRVIKYVENFDSTG
ncbi:MAG: hypothetical protein ABEH43_11655, partial [Flavobacteriales bacterium]